MAISTEDPKEDTSVLTEARDDNPDHRKYEHTEEVPALLGKVAACSNEETGNVSNEDVAKEPHVLVDSVEAVEVRQDVSAELQNIRDTLQDSLIAAKYISAKIDAVSNDTDCLIKQINGLSGKYELLAAGMESSSSDNNSKSILSKTFLTISASIVATLAVFQMYMFVSMIKTERKQTEAVSLVMGNLSTLNKKMTYHNVNIAKAPINTTQQEHPQPGQPAAENSASEAHGGKEAASVHTTPVLERLNRLRNGLPEKRLIRKETGDWFAYNKKSEECIADVEVVEALNEAYKKIGRSLTPTVPLPAHNALCILKPDGKGGTEIVMTKAFVP